ncbi:hypothetical protein C5C07_15465 [Haloferax sp. Atlit-4N]|uniref:hypothetical protein n=1 Tax=Haloferax sp. Atlit-4N TaxID=2077206 RepID=UPI000E24B707|nr:hypothetical protein [Haloferax sp. Atlit-4N]RDZ53132.1 hypothetical protein C5C07_15465 [Haloferax sp. Atlit-4N]
MSNDEPVDGDCNYHPTQDGGYCAQTAGMGTDHLGEGHCKYHGGAAPGGAREGSGAPDDNTNAVTHGAYADHNRFYQKVLDDSLRDLVDDIFDDYLSDYEDRHGEPPLGHEMELFRISVAHVKDVVLDNWAETRPDDLDSGHPLVDKETQIKTTQDGRALKQQRYRESVVLAAQGKLSRDRRQWLKDLGLLEDPDSQQAQAMGTLVTALTGGDD